MVAAIILSIAALIFLIALCWGVIQEADLGDKISYLLWKAKRAIFVNKDCTTCVWHRHFDERPDIEWCVCPEAQTYLVRYMMAFPVGTEEFATCAVRKTPGCKYKKLQLNLTGENK